MGNFEECEDCKACTCNTMDYHVLLALYNKHRGMNFIERLIFLFKPKLELWKYVKDKGG